MELMLLHFIQTPKLVKHMQFVAVADIYMAKE